MGGPVEGTGEPIVAAAEGPGDSVASVPPPVGGGDAIGPRRSLPLLSAALFVLIVVNIVYSLRY